MWVGAEFQKQQTHITLQPMHAYLDELHASTSLNDNEKWENKQSDDTDRSLRVQLAEQYAWAIPSSEIINKLVDYSPIVEIGAGTGYWAHLINQHGGDVVAIDPDPPDTTWTDIKQRTHEHVIKYPNHTLLMCWPAFVKHWPVQTIKDYPGNRAVYVGEPRGGNCGSVELHDEIRRSFGPATDVIPIPQWEARNDKAYVFERDTKPDR